ALAFPPQVRIHDDIMWTNQDHVKISDRITPRGGSEAAAARLRFRSAQAHQEGRTIPMLCYARLCPAPDSARQVRKKAHGSLRNCRDHREPAPRRRKRHLISGAKQGNARFTFYGHSLRSVGGTVLL